MLEFTAGELTILSLSLAWRHDYYRQQQKAATQKQYEHYQHEIDIIEDMEKRIEDELRNRIGV